jgi:hypothetical protein
MPIAPEKYAESCLVLTVLTRRNNNITYRFRQRQFWTYTEQAALPQPRISINISASWLDCPIGRCLLWKWTSIERRRYIRTATSVVQQCPRTARFDESPGQRFMLYSSATIAESCRIETLWVPKTSGTSLGIWWPTITRCLSKFGGRHSTVGNKKLANCWYRGIGEGGPSLLAAG